MYYLLFTSFFLNIVFAWFIFKLLQRISDLVALIEDILFKVTLFQEHLKSVYELEMFYGDVTLEKLLQHSYDLVSSFEQFKQDYELLTEEEIYDKLQEKSEDQG